MVVAVFITDIIPVRPENERNLRQYLSPQNQN